MSNEYKGEEVGTASKPEIKEETSIAGRIFCRPDCKYCFGRGYERWIVNRTTKPDGSKHETFADTPCRKARTVFENVSTEELTT